MPGFKGLVKWHVILGKGLRTGKNAETEIQNFMIKSIFSLFVLWVTELPEIFITTNKVEIRIGMELSSEFITELKKDAVVVVQKCRGNRAYISNPVKIFNSLSIKCFFLLTGRFVLYFLK